MRQGERQTKKQGDRILVLRSIAGYLVVPGLAANIFVWSGYDFSQPDTYDYEFMSWTLMAAFGYSLFAYIIIPLFSLPYHIYFVKYGKATLKNYMILWTSIGIAVAILWIIDTYQDCYLNISCSPYAIEKMFIPALKFVLIGCLGGLIFWLIVCRRHDFNAADRAP